MANIIESIYEFLTAPGDLSTGNRFLPYNGAMLPYLLITVFYVLFVFKIGPFFMRKRQPYNLRSVLRYYNIGQIIYNTVISSLGIYLYLIKAPLALTCITILPTGHPLKNIEGLMSALYVVNKFIDYFDTIFFVLRKSYKQVTFLHVYHHIMISSLSLIYMRYSGGGGHAVTVGILNSFVHAVMYAYYLVSATHPEMENSLWWKKYVTKLQLIQFVVLFVHQMWPLVVQTDCDYPKFLLLLSCSQAIFMIYLFSSFYIRTYIIRPKKETRITQEAKTQ
ncbi:PREDICTED: elongation of very long chain fatty acids protein 4-like [Bactrocera latifrons]|uniref:Elongation of very long chain fatty acids protein n=1 Tax=Bactrocera latifrons TaxID=174628 RepID=A0A0K8V4K0_BACLA|nr:PREDICTED: elongation of very long chain fatty acids protein 4-like [Bactrocera latifrons]